MDVETEQNNISGPPKLFLNEIIMFAVVGPFYNTFFFFLRTVRR